MFRFSLSVQFSPGGGNKTWKEKKKSRNSLSLIHFSKMITIVFKAFSSFLPNPTDHRQSRNGCEWRVNI